MVSCEPVSATQKSLKSRFAEPYLNLNIVTPHRVLFNPIRGNCLSMREYSYWRVCSSAICHLSSLLGTIDSIFCHCLTAINAQETDANPFSIVLGIGRMGVAPA